ncbi:hypothetical protein N7490_002762 [Penicillium lividum]|nr:hypothetical protein N7490_002762 [Penicillium lividum]
MTTRKADVLEQFERPWELVFVHRMEVSPAQTWLETKLRRRETDPEKVGMALEELTFLQLGIMVAAAYINYRGANYSVEQYVDDLCNGEFSALTLAGHVEPHLNMRESLFTPCQLSIEYLLDVRPSAVDVLFRASFFDEQGIPEYLLRNQPEYDECANTNETDVSDTSSFTIMDGFEDDIQTLKDFCLITTDITGKTLRMHSLIQDSTKKWLKANGEFDKWQQIFLNKMYDDFPVPDSSTLGTCQLLFPHVQKAIAHPPITYSSESFTEWVALVYKASTFACQCCNVEAAEKLIQLAIDEQTKQLGPNDPSVLATEDLMGELYCSVRQWQRAEALSTDLVAKSREILGHEHPDTLRRQARLIQLYSKQGRYQDAEAGYIELVTTSKLVWGFQHQDTLEYLSKLAAVLAMQEKWVAAEIALKEAVNGSIQSLGEGHTETLERMKSLVRIFMAQGRARALEAEALQIQVVDICRAPEEPERWL